MTNDLDSRGIDCYDVPYIPESYVGEHYGQEYTHEPLSFDDYKPYAARASIDTYHSTSEEDLADGFDDVPQYAHEPLPIEAIPTTPRDFADLFPSARRISIRHDDATIDGNMNLRIDAQLEERHRKKQVYTLFHLRMQDLRSREFSLRRYCRDSGREVCHSIRKYQKPPVDMKRRVMSRERVSVYDTTPSDFTAQHDLSHSSDTASLHIGPSRKGQASPYSGKKRSAALDFYERSWYTNHFSGTEWWRKGREKVNCTIERLKQKLYGLDGQQKWISKLVSIPLKRHKSVVAMFLGATNLSVASAAGDPEPIQSRGPIFRSDSPSDYAMAGVMVLYLAIMFSLRAKTNLHQFAFSLSFGLMNGMGLLWVIVNRDEFADGIRETVLEIWLTTTLHVGAQYCYDNYSPKLHVITFLSLSTVFGLTLLRFPSTSPLDALPPFVAVVALIVWALHDHGKPANHRQRQHDEERGETSPTDDGSYALDDLTLSNRQTSAVHHD